MGAFKQRCDNKPLRAWTKRVLLRLTADDQRWPSQFHKVLMTKESPEPDSKEQYFPHLPFCSQHTNFLSIDAGRKQDSMRAGK